MEDKTNEKKDQLSCHSAAKEKDNTVNSKTDAGHDKDTDVRTNQDKGLLFDPYEHQSLFLMSKFARAAWQCTIITVTAIIDQWMENLKCNIPDKMAWKAKAYHWVSSVLLFQRKVKNLVDINKMNHAMMSELSIFLVMLFLEKGRAEALKLIEIYVVIIKRLKELGPILDTDLESIARVWIDIVFPDPEKPDEMKKHDNLAMSMFMFSCIRSGKRLSD